MTIRPRKIKPGKSVSELPSGTSATRKPKRKEKKAAKVSKLTIQASRHKRKMETGKMLVIDPSSGSRESMPGYALYEMGALIESGTIGLKFHKEPHARLRDLGAILRRDFPIVDVLVVENLPPFMQSAGSSFRSKGTINLHRAVGAIFASVDCSSVIEVSPGSWHAFVRRLEAKHGFTYGKTDMADAIVMGLTAYAAAGLFAPVTSAIINLIKEGGGTDGVQRGEDDEDGYIGLLSGDTEDGSDSCSSGTGEEME